MTPPENTGQTSTSENVDGEILLSRRAVIKLGLVGLAGAATGLGATAVFTHRRTSAPSKYRFFSEAEAALLIDICDQIIPADDLPGAKQTGAINYIDRQLSGVFASQQPAYRRGLASFNQTCIQDFMRPFQELTPALKIQALQAIEAGRAPAELWGNPSPQAFFNLVLAHTMQSFYGSPRHGGNRDYASYRMLGLEYPQVVGQNRYTEK